MLFKTQIRKEWPETLKNMAISAPGKSNADMSNHKCQGVNW